MNAAEQVAAALESDGWRYAGGEYVKRLEGFAPAGTVSSGARVVTLALCERGRWLERRDGCGKAEREIDLRQFPNDPREAIAAALAR